MRFRQICESDSCLLAVLYSCKKSTGPVVPPPVQAPKILLKEIDITGRAPLSISSHTIMIVPFPRPVLLPDAICTMSFIQWTKIAEMRDLNPSNKDTLRYVYDGQGKLSVINIIDNDTHLIFRRFVFTFEGDRLMKMERDHVEGTDFLPDNVEQLDYYPDGNLKTKIVSSTVTPGDFTDTTRYEQYDNKSECR